MANITIDWANKIFDIDSPATDIDVQNDIYEYWKEQIQIGDNSKWPQAMLSIGGESLPGGKFVPSFFFLLNGWKVRSYVGTTSINVSTNLFADDGSDPYISGGTRCSIIAATTTGVTVTTAGVSISPADILAISQGVWAEVLANTKTAEDNLIEARDEAELSKSLSA